MIDTQIQFLLKVNLVKNKYIQKSHQQLIAELKRLGEKYIEIKEYGTKTQN